MKKYVIGVDLGGTKISTAISTIEGNILANVVLPTKAEEGEAAVLGRIVQSIDEVIVGSSTSIDEIEAIRFTRTFRCEERNNNNNSESSF